MSTSSQSSSSLIRPPKTAFDFYCLMISDEQNARNKDGNIVIQEADIFSMCHNRWENMTDNEKRRFYDLEKRDLERHQAEMASSSGRGRSTHQSESAFFIFAHDKRSDLHQKFPQYDEPQIARECLKLWNQLSAEERHFWQQKAYEGHL